MKVSWIISFCFYQASRCGPCTVAVVSYLCKGPYNTYAFHMFLLSCGGITLALACVNEKTTLLYGDFAVKPSVCLLHCNGNERIALRGLSLFTCLMLVYKRRTSPTAVHFFSFRARCVNVVFVLPTRCAVDEDRPVTVLNMDAPKTAAITAAPLLCKGYCCQDAVKAS